MYRLIPIALLFWIQASGQVTKPDTAFVRAAVGQAKSTYDRALHGESGLYNGLDYPEYVALMPGVHPFFISNQMTDGSILYGGQTYENVGLRYDICHDKVVVEHYYNHSILELVSERITGFTLHGHRFIHLTPNKKNNLKDGFYDLLYDGPSRVIARHEKVLEEIKGGQRVRYQFKDNTRFYVLKDGSFSMVYSKASLLKALNKHKSELRNFPGSEQIRFRKDRGKAIAAMARYYDTLNP
jgi:hypothetical protein